MRAFILMLVLAALTAGLAFPAWAEEFEYKDYEVRKGDTLWDISRVELQDPFNWPIVWRENSWIKNPDLIYPGQKIRIPVGLLKQAEAVPAALPAPTEEISTAPPPPAPQEPEAKPLEVKGIREISADDILRGGYISWEVPDAGEIIGSPGGRLVVGGMDEVYIKGVDSPKVGDKFYVVRATAKVRHPKTNKKMGHLVRVLGVLEVQRVGIADVTARITKGFDQIGVGDRLDRYYDVEPVLLTGKAREPEVEGFVVAATQMRLLNGILDLVYIDKGREDGLVPGDVIATLYPGTPDRANGVLRVISTRDDTATAMVLTGVLDVSIGHDVASCKKVAGCVVKR